MSYELLTRVMLLLLRVFGTAGPVAWFAKVWLRQSRIVRHLRFAQYDFIIDGGASIGEFAALARLAAPLTPIVCVEPHPPSAARLRKRGFDVVEAALWDHAGSVCLSQPAEAATSCTVTDSAAPGTSSWNVQAIRLDELPVVGSKILIKLDLQGAEPVALTGMGMLWERCHAILLEVSYGSEGTYEGLRALLTERGYFEAATLNELEDESGPIEADKLFVKR